MIMEDSDSEEEYKEISLRGHQLESIDENVEYDSDENQSNLLESECQLTGEQLKSFKSIAKLGEGGYARVIL